MIKHNQVGSINSMLLPFIVSVVLLLGALGFGGWAYSERQDYKNNVDQKIADAVTIAKQEEGTRKDKIFAEEEKKPLKSYRGPEELGSLVIEYPKTWSSYEVRSGTQSINGYFHPGTVPSVQEQASTFALRYAILDRKYADVVRTYSGQIRTGKLTSKPYALPEVSSEVGIRLDGTATNNKTISLVMVPMRDKTLQIWTEGGQFNKDFEENILPNVTFAP